MKKLTFLFLIVLLFGFNYAYSQESDFEEVIKVCKNLCSFVNNNLKFCERICEIEIFDPRWRLYNFNSLGSAYFYDPESISTSYNIVKVWTKIIYSEKDKQRYIKKFGKKYKKLDYSLSLSEIDCSKKRYRVLNLVYYALNGSVIDITDNFLAEWHSIIPDSVQETLFEEVCETEE
jgi:hypothetical protein